MKVSDIMLKRVNYARANAPVKDVCRLIFGGGINGVPVCEGKKVIGFISEGDILSKFYPSMKEFVEDTVHSTNFEDMEKKFSEIFSLKTRDIMSTNPITVEADTPLLKAYSLMTVRDVGRVPVVDKDRNLVGILSRGDIFRVLIGDNLPLSSDEEYHDWLSRHYDLVIDWGQRLGSEIPNLVNLFRKEKIQNVIDIGFGTGEHDIALAEEGFNILGIENSALMYSTAKRKLNNLPEKIREKIEIFHDNYVDILKNQNKEYNAAIFMGNAFAHIVDNYEKVFEVLSKVLSPKKALIVLQIVNFNKILYANNRFQNLNFAKSRLGLVTEHAFLEFYDPPQKKGGNLTLTMVILDRNGKKWSHRATNSTPIVNIDQDKIKDLLRKYGFKNISCFGGMNLGPLFKHPFDSYRSDWLNVIAKR